MHSLLFKEHNAMPTMIPGQQRATDRSSAPATSKAGLADEKAANRNADAPASNATNAEQRAEVPCRREYGRIAGIERRVGEPCGKQAERKGDDALRPTSPGKRAGFSLSALRAIFRTEKKRHGRHPLSPTEPCSDHPNG